MSEYAHIARGDMWEIVAVAIVFEHTVGYGGGAGGVTPEALLLVPATGLGTHAAQYISGVGVSG